MKSIRFVWISWQFYAWKEKSCSLILTRARSARCSRTTFEPFILFAVLQQPIFQKGLLNKTCDSRLFQHKEIDSSMQTICARNVRSKNKFEKWICDRSLKIYNNVMILYLLFHLSHFLRLNIVKTRTFNVAFLLANNFRKIEWQRNICDEMT